MIVHLSKEFRFEASHQLPNHDGKCARLHGHSWKLKVWVAGHVMDIIPKYSKEGMVVDYSDIKTAVQPIVDGLDHHHLGSGVIGGDAVAMYVGPDDNLPNFPPIPTSENILIWISQQIPSYLAWVRLELSETCTANAVLERAQHEIWLPDIQVEQPVAAEAINDDDIPF